MGEWEKTREMGPVSTVLAPTPLQRLHFIVIGAVAAKKRGTYHATIVSLNHSHPAGLPLSSLAPSSVTGRRGVSKCRQKPECLLHSSGSPGHPGGHQHSECSLKMKPARYSAANVSILTGRGIPGCLEPNHFLIGFSHPPIHSLSLIHYQLHTYHSQSTRGRLRCRVRL